MAKVCGLCGRSMSIMDGYTYCGSVLVCHECYRPYEKVWNSIGVQGKFDENMKEFIAQIKAKGSPAEIENLKKIVEYLEELHISDLQEIAEVNKNMEEDAAELPPAEPTREYQRIQIESAAYQSSSGSRDSASDTSGMYGNIAGKIKTLAQVVAWLGIIGSVVTWLVLVARDEDLLAAGLIIAVIGALISWVSSFVLYGYGQLIENTDKLVELTRKNAEGANKSKK